MLDARREEEGNRKIETGYLGDGLIMALVILAWADGASGFWSAVWDRLFSEARVGAIAGLGNPTRCFRLAGDSRGILPLIHRLDPLNWVRVLRAGSPFLGGG